MSLAAAHCRGVPEAVEDLLLPLDAEVVPVDGDLARWAWRIFQRFVKGQGHDAQLNFGDCSPPPWRNGSRCPSPLLATTSAPPGCEWRRASGGPVPRSNHYGTHGSRERDAAASVAKVLVAEDLVDTGLAGHGCSKPPLPQGARNS